MNLKVEWRVFVVLLGGEFSELTVGPFFNGQRILFIQIWAVTERMSSQLKATKLLGSSEEICILEPVEFDHVSD